MSFNNNLQGMGSRAVSGGGGKGKLAVSGGLGTIIIAGAVLLMGGSPSQVLSILGQGNQNSPSSSTVSNLEHCNSVEAANTYDDCRVEATAISLDNFWTDYLPQESSLKYTQPHVWIGEGAVNTGGCGQGNPSQQGPFYCPGSSTVFLAPSFFGQLASMGGSKDSFSQMYVVAHEFGHHIQQLEGNLSKSDYNNPGADSNAVAVELQADCYAGLWAHHADKGDNAVLNPLSSQDIASAIQSAQAIGDDAIQRGAGQEVNSDLWTHGSSEQRQESFERGYNSGEFSACRASFS